MYSCDYGQATVIRYGTFDGSPEKKKYFPKVKKVTSTKRGVKKYFSTQYEFPYKIRIKYLTIPASMQTEPHHDRKGKKYNLLKPSL